MCVWEYVSVCNCSYVCVYALVYVWKDRKQFSLSNYTSWWDAHYPQNTRTINYSTATSFLKPDPSIKLCSKDSRKQNKSNKDFQIKLLVWGRPKPLLLPLLMPIQFSTKNLPAYLNLIKRSPAATCWNDLPRPFNANLQCSPYIITFIHHLILSL